MGYFEYISEYDWLHEQTFGGTRVRSRKYAFSHLKCESRGNPHPISCIHSSYELAADTASAAKSAARSSCSVEAFRQRSKMWQCEQRWEECNKELPSQFLLCVFPVLQIHCCYCSCFVYLFISNVLKLLARTPKFRTDFTFVTAHLQRVMWA